ncbi:MAG: carbohydrate-binding family V/XII [Pseudomonadota bacterium]
MRKPWERLLACVLLVLPTLADATYFPRDFTAADGTVITLFEPQLQDLTGNDLRALGAVSVKPAGSEEPIFGAIQIEARLDIDREERVAYFEEVRITQTRFPTIEDENQQRLAWAVEREINTWDLDASLDDLLVQLDRNALGDGSPDYEMAPPNVIVRNWPALLVVLDGEPALREIEGTSMFEVMNTPYTLLFDPGSRAYYLNAGDAWFAAADLADAWTVSNPLPDAVAAFVGEDAPDESWEVPEDLPEIIVATEPTELIAIDGVPTFTPTANNALFFVSNTESDVFRHVDSGTWFVLLSGRWYSAPSLEGEWTWVPAEDLLAAFADIPADSTKGDVRTFVEGTNEADEAVLDAQIPQTAAVKREGTTIEVVYDGAPKFENIPGTTIDHALNTPTSVLRVSGRYYAVEEGVWYLSASPTGPWRVADHRPPEVSSIPPESPVYNVKYVYVYDVTPQYVYVGYTPGYLGSYVYGPTIVYGTGWYYRPWVSPYYFYPRPVTWGVRVNYNPWTGWSFGIGWRSGPFYFGVSRGGYYRGSHWGVGGWWGPGGYRTSFNYTRVNINGNNNRPRPVPYGDRRNLYARGDNRNRAVTRDRPVARDRAARPATRDVSQRPEVFADRSGDVFRRSNDGWQRHTSSGWVNSDVQRPTTRPTTPGSRPGQGETRPGQPATRPAQRPAQPVTRPSQPATRPTSRPAQPVTRPSQPATRPTTRPAQPRTMDGWQRSTSQGRTLQGHSSLPRQAQARQRGAQRSQQFNQHRAQTRPAGRRGG